jgi:hypothetical protein
MSTTDRRMLFSSQELVQTKNCGIKHPKEMPMQDSTSAWSLDILGRSLILLLGQMHHRPLLSLRASPSQCEGTLDGYAFLFLMEIF